MINNFVLITDNSDLSILLIFRSCVQLDNLQLKTCKYLWYKNFYVIKNLIKINLNIYIHYLQITKK